MPCYYLRGPPAWPSSGQPCMHRQIKTPVIAHLAAAGLAESQRVGRVDRPGPSCCSCTRGLPAARQNRAQQAPGRHPLGQCQHRGPCGERACGCAHMLQVRPLAAGAASLAGLDTLLQA